MSDTFKKIFIFGLDGATWKIISPLIEKGVLPNLRYLKESGVSGRLLSIEPPFSPAVWTSLSTGKLPNKHGITLFFTKSNMVRAARIWDILEKEGMTVGIYGHLVTWPPRPIKGFIIPDDILANDAQTYPPEYTFLRQLVINEKKQNISGGLHRYFEYLIKFREFGIPWYHLLRGFGTLVSSKIFDYRFLDLYYRQRFLKEDIQSDAFAHLNRKHNCDFSFYYCNITDSCAHLYWRYMEPEKFPGTAEKDTKRYGNVIPLAYQKADVILGKILRSLDSSTSVWVVSDHGFKAASTDHKGSTFRIKTESLVNTLSIAHKVEFSNLGSHTFLSVKKPFEDERDDIIDRIKGIRLSENGYEVFTVHRDYESKNRIDVALKETRKSLMGYHIEVGGKLYRYETLVQEEDARISGEHDPEGIFVAKGQGIERGKWIGDTCNVVDIAPTLLAYLGLPIARDMDGHIIGQVFEKGYFSKRLLSYIDSYDGDIVVDEAEDYYEPSKEVIERLKTLGYL